ncbi:hypothetical protein [Aquifex aeolicus]|uniref:hypothetical protein n=1 Tax=Aquifex aeolicus TaxID=63363 RepID=UPI0002F160FF|nr:hypothetical protein [Aquifex aeolicus]
MIDYLEAKFLHLIGLFIWASSSASFGIFMEYANYKETGCNKKELRKFYRILTNLEILGFFTALISGLYMVKLLGNIPEWLRLKMYLVFLVILPLEVINFYLVNFYVPKRGEKAYSVYDRFNYVAFPVVVIVSLFLVYLAVIKP